MQTQEPKLTFKNYIGYALCDISGMLAFSAIGSYISVFYTDVLKISTGAVFLIMLLARVWDGIDDPVTGILIQRRKPDRFGKYRSLILIFGILLAICGPLTMLKIPGLTTTGYALYAGATYILYGVLYSFVLLPYGSMASVMTRKESERSTLSIFRSVGGGIGSLPATILFPLLVFDGNVLNEKKLFLAMAILGVLMIVLYFLSFKWTKENYPSPEPEEKLNLKELAGSLLHNRAFLVMALVCCLHMAVSLYMTTTNVYLFKDYFGKPGLIVFLTVASYAPMILMMFFLNRLIARFGKKLLCMVGLAIATVTSLIAFFCRFTNPYAYLAVSFFINVGAGFLTLEVWALALDVVDAQEYKSGKRQEPIVFAVFTFMRKMGQALAALAPLFVGIVGYDSDLVGTGQNASTLEGLYDISTIVPFLIFLTMLALMFLYPLNKKRMDDMQRELAVMRSKTDE